MSIFHVEGIVVALVGGEQALEGGRLLGIGGLGGLVPGAREAGQRQRAIHRSDSVARQRSRLLLGGGVVAIQDIQQLLAVVEGDLAG